jgi:tRNA(adenine34) deaminase
MKLKTSPDRDWIPYMKRALELAKEGERLGDIPIGAVVVDAAGTIIAEAYNEREINRDPTAHAEVLALKRASEARGEWRMVGCTLVVTLEPCVMCSGALSLSRVDRVVYGASDPKAGAMGSIYEIHEDRRLNHVIDVIPGVCLEECRTTLLTFFRSKRDKTKA